MKRSERLGYDERSRGPSTTRRWRFAQDDSVWVGKGVALRCGVFVLPLSGWGTAAVRELHECVDDGAGEGDDCGEEQGVHAGHAFGAGVEECEGQQKHGAAADEDERELIAGDAEGALQVGLGAAEDDEGEELEDERRAPEEEVDGDEALEGERERERPGEAAEEHADPGNTFTRAEGEQAREETVFGHRVGKAREGEGEGVEGAEAVERAGENHGEHE